MTDNYGQKEKQLFLTLNYTNLHLFEVVSQNSKWFLILNYNASASCRIVSGFDSCHKDFGNYNYECYIKNYVAITIHMNFLSKICSTFIILIDVLLQ